MDSIYELADVIYGASFKSRQFNETGAGFPLIRIRDLKTASPRFYTEEDVPGARLVEAGALLVGMDGEFRANLWLGRRARLNQRVCEFVAKMPASRGFVRYALEALLMEQESTKTATTVIHLLKRDIDRFVVKSPGKQLLRRFAEVTEPLLDLTVANAEQSRTLAEIRDALLPKLVSGEIRVGDQDG